MRAWPCEPTGNGLIREASVSRLPFSDATFDVITAVETHFWWPNLLLDTLEVLRVLKPGGKLILIAEVYKGAASFSSRAVERFSKNRYGASYRRCQQGVTAREQVMTSTIRHVRSSSLDTWLGFTNDIISGKRLPPRRIH